MSRHDGGPHDGSPATSPYPLQRLSAPHDLVDVAREIQKADGMLSAVVGAKLESIARQIRALQEEARVALESARRHAELHRARCALRKVPGHVYHLYELADGERYFSLLSPEDWNGQPPHPYVGGYRLEADLRFTPLSDLDERDRELAQLRPLLGR